MAIDTFSQPSPHHQNFVWHSAANDSSFSVSFPQASDMEMILIGAELYQGMEEHDRLVLHFKGHPLLKKQALVSGDPVVFVFRSGKTTSTWNGYIHHVKQDNTHQSGNTDIVCVGASWVLKDTDQQVYTNCTADQAIMKIAAKHGMSAITQRHPRVRDSIVQAGQSDWQMCRRIANQTGFALRTENTTIFFISKEKIFQNKKITAPYFKYVDDQNGGVVTRELRMTGTILEFKPIISDQAPEFGIRVDRVVSGVDKKTGAVIKTVHPHKGPTPTNPGVVIPNEGYFLK